MQCAEAAHLHCGRTTQWTAYMSHALFKSKQVQRNHRKVVNQVTLSYGLTFQVCVASVLRMSWLHSSRPRCYCDQLPLTTQSSTPLQPQLSGGPVAVESCVSSWNRTEKKKKKPAHRLKHLEEPDTNTCNTICFMVRSITQAQTNIQVQHT